MMNASRQRVIKVMDMETRIAELTEELARGGGSRRGNGAGSSTTAGSLPRPPERLTLTGHRGPVTAVAFHPTFGVVYTASEDTTIKVNVDNCHSSVRSYESNSHFPPSRSGTLTLGNSSARSKVIQRQFTEWPWILEGPC